MLQTPLTPTVFVRALSLKNLTHFPYSALKEVSKHLHMLFRQVRTRIEKIYNKINNHVVFRKSKIRRNFFCTRTIRK